MSSKNTKSGFFFFVRQVSGGTAASPRRDKRWDLERTGERIRGGLRKIVRGVERACEKKTTTLDCTVCNY